MKKVLTIAGSDPTGAAGLEQDLRVLQAFGCHGMAVATAHTVQDADAVHAVRIEDPVFFRARLEVLQGRYRPDVIKLGMLADEKIVAEVLRILDSWGRGPALVIDPVFMSSSGRALLSPAGLRLFARELLPRADVLTPNFSEAKGLLQALNIDCPSDPTAIAKTLADYGPELVCLTGGDQKGPDAELFARDYVCRRDEDEYFVMESPRSPGESPHGTGCAFASAVAAAMSGGRGASDALRDAKAFVSEAIAASTALGPECDRRRVLVFKDADKGAGQ